jgi:hypothetical protein
MLSHDPYRHIIHYLDLFISDDNHSTSLRTRIDQLKAQYNKCDYRNIDYNDPLTQAAYLLYYFPLYIDLIEDLVCEIHRSHREKLDDTFSKKMNVSVYGGGPEPEILGFLKSISKYGPVTEEVKFTSCDNNNWNDFRSYCHRQMVQDYWQGKFEYLPLDEFNVCNFLSDSHLLKHPMVTEADIHIFQNSAIDIISSFNDVDKIKDLILSILNSAKIGSIFILINVPTFARFLPTSPPQEIDIRRILHSIQSTIRKNDQGSILKYVSSTSAPKTITPDILIHREIMEKYNLKRTVKYHSLVIKKKT